jgi:serine/threonine protein kinase
LAEEEVKDATKSNRLLRMSRHKAGTPQFMAPEIIERGEYSTAVDWWATGVTFFNCAVGQHLFRGRDHASLYAQICSGEINLGPLRPVSETLQNLVSRLVERDVSKRLGGGRVIRTHRFFVAMDEQRRTVRGGPPFRPPSMPVQYLAEKNLLLFYGARGLARASGTPRRPLFSTSAGSLGVLKRAKKIARQRMRREFSRFASISELRERWLRGLGTGEAQLPLTSSDHDHS